MNLRPLKLQKKSFAQAKQNTSLKLRRVRKVTGKLFPFLLLAGMFMVLAIFLSTFSGSSSVVSKILSGTSLKNSGGRVNILLLGIPGGRHNGANLTDTIMVASYELKSNNVILISIPRDLWLPAFAAKANAVYQIGLGQKNGLELTKTVMGNILGLPIHYVVSIDFQGFEKAVDVLGGIDLSIDAPFDDYNYPITGKENDLCGYEEKEIDFSESAAKELNIPAGKRKVFIAPDGKIATDSAEEDKGSRYFSCRYEHLHFNKGLVTMDGVTALKFVRSRHGTNGEASDFARSKRQQKVLEAMKGKALSFEILGNPAKLTELYNTFDKSIDTDITIKDTIELYKLSRKMDKISAFVLDDSPKAALPNSRTSLLVNPPRDSYGGAYVLVSLDDDFSIVQGYVRKILTGEITNYDATASARAR